MRVIALLIIVFSTFVEAEEGCLFPPCPPPPTGAEIQAANDLFKKTKFILGAAFDSQNKHYDPAQSYKNIPDFVARTNRLKADLKSLQAEAKQLNLQAGRVELSVALAEAHLCVSFNKSAMQYCTQSLNTLKSWVWEKQFGSHWSGYQSSGDWVGFPEN